MPEKAETLEHIEKETLERSAKFFLGSKVFAGYPKPLLRKTEEKIEENSETFSL
jgi:hypothetical protein